MGNRKSDGSAAGNNRRFLLRTLLKGVSRAFYLSIRVLPPRMREPVAVAYLLARAADTIADTASLPLERRTALLIEFRKIADGEANDQAATSLFDSLVGHSANSGGAVAPRCVALSVRSSERS